MFLGHDIISPVVLEYFLPSRPLYCIHYIGALIVIFLMFQAPVSDREYKATLPETAAMIDLASKMISEDRGSELMPREANPDSPITAYR